MSEFIFPSDAARAEHDELQRVCEYLEEVMDERDALAAQNARLRGELEYVVKRVEEGTMRSRVTYGRFVEILSETPATSMAEIKAQAIDDHLDPITMSMAPSNDYYLGWNDAMHRMSAHANNIRKEAGNVDQV
jgi:cell division septum initiation protein DivIVA